MISVQRPSKPKNFHSNQSQKHRFIKRVHTSHSNKYPPRHQTNKNQISLYENETFPNALLSPYYDSAAPKFYHNFMIFPSKCLNLIILSSKICLFNFFFFFSGWVINVDSIRLLFDGKLYNMKSRFLRVY